LEPGQRIFAVAPDPRNRLELWAIRRSGHATHVLRDGELVGGMRAPGVQEPEIQAVGEGLGEQIDAELEVLRVQRGPCQTEALSAGGRPRAIDREPCEDMLARPDGRHPTGSEAPPAHRQQANAAFLLAKDPNGAAVL
jgi:hypothetical protein